ncbi:MAG: ABC transporter substrate-binding protein [Pseudomonadota bacterium]
MKLRFFKTVLASAALLLAGSAALAQQGVTAQEITIGAVGPLTGSTAFIGAPARDSMQLAADAINKRGGVNGRKFKLVFEHAFSPAESVAAAKKLVEQDKVYALVLASGSTGAAAAADYVRSAGIPTYNLFGSTPVIREPFASNIFHGTITNTDTSASALIAQLKRGNEKKPQRIGVLAGTYAYPQANLALLKPMLDKEGIPVTLEVFDQNAKDFTAQLVSFTRAKVDAVMILGSFTEAGFAIKQAPQVGLVNVRWVLDGSAVNNAIIPIIGNADGIRGYYNAPYYPGQAAQPMEGFEALWKSAYGTPPQGRPNMFDIIGYGSTYVLAEAIQAAGNDLSWKNLNSKWENLKQAQPSKLGGFDVIFPETYTPKDHQCNKALGPTEIVKGKWVVLP